MIYQEHSLHNTNKENNKATKCSLKPPTPYSTLKKQPLSKTTSSVDKQRKWQNNALDGRICDTVGVRGFDFSQRRIIVDFKTSI